MTVDTGISNDQRKSENDEKLRNSHAGQRVKKWPRQIARIRSMRAFRRILRRKRRRQHLVILIIMFVLTLTVLLLFQFL